MRHRSLHEPWLTALITLWAALLIPVYMYFYGITNFLWVSDIGLFLTWGALLFGSHLCMSMAAVGVCASELLWAIDFLVHLIANYDTTHIADYMFNQDLPLFLRGLSLFHIVLLFIWIRSLLRYGYDHRAPLYFIPLYWCLISITYRYTDPQANINWVFHPPGGLPAHLSPLGWLIALAVGVPLFIILPTDYLLKKLFPRSQSI